MRLKKGWKALARIPFDKLPGCLAGEYKKACFFRGGIVCNGYSYSDISVQPPCPRLEECIKAVEKCT